MRSGRRWAASPRRQPEERTLTGLSLLLQSNALKAALAPYTLEGPFGRLLDAAEDRLALARRPVLRDRGADGPGRARSLPVLTYLFHRLEERFDGRPTLLVLDEAWLFLDNPLFAARIREWLKVLRKKNVAVIFATQSLADIADSSIAPAIIESCPQRIFLPNDRAVEPQARAAYERFGLNERQIELIARATPKRRLLPPVARAATGCSTSASAGSRSPSAARRIRPPSGGSTASSPKQGAGGIRAPLARGPRPRLGRRAARPISRPPTPEGEDEVKKISG